MKPVKSSYADCKALFLFIHAFISANASSIGLKSGEYGGRYSMITPASQHKRSTFYALFRYNDLDIPQIDGQEHCP